MCVCVSEREINVKIKTVILSKAYIALNKQYISIQILDMLENSPGQERMAASLANGQEKAEFLNPTVF